jgi:hypothetical protein
MSSQAIEGLLALGLIVGIGAIAFIGVVLMIAQLCRQLVAQMGAKPVGGKRCAARTLRDADDQSIVDGLAYLAAHYLNDRDDK